MLAWETDLRKRLSEYGERGEDIIARIHAYFAIGATRETRIMPYRGYSNGEATVLRGRTLYQYRTPQPTQDDDPLYLQALAYAITVNSAALPNADLSVTFDGHTHALTSDKRGYFQLTLDGCPTAQEGIWHPATYHTRGQPAVESSVMTLAQDAQFGIISDVDNIILPPDPAQMWRDGELFEPPYQPTMLNGVAAFYEALQRGTRPTTNPLFYMSNGTWRTFSLLDGFLNATTLPQAPLFLRDKIPSTSEFVVDNNHKSKMVEKLLLFYPDLPFILIGDSGEKDTLVYASLARKYPDHILAIYLRNGDNTQRTARRVMTLFEAARDTNTPISLIKNCIDAAKHAYSYQIITEDSLTQITTIVEQSYQSGSPPCP